MGSLTRAIEHNSHETVVKSANMFTRHNLKRAKQNVRCRPKGGHVFWGLCFCGAGAVAGCVCTTYILCVEHPR